MTASTHMLHLAFGWALLTGVVSMAVKDALGTLMMVSESRGEARWASWADAFGDIAQVAFQVAGAGTVILTGLGWRSGVVLLAIMITSKIGTQFWTDWAGKHLPEDQRLVELRNEIAGLRTIMEAKP